MEAWQRIGTYAAGLALESAGVKGDKEILGRMDMVIAAGGGERDIRVDTTILNAKAKGNAPPGFLNERLMGDLRPTLFLAQLSNLLAGNIAIVHGVCGTSRTFMGEEAAGVDAARIALARIAAGQSDIALIGGSHNGERKDLLLLYGFGDYNLRDKFAPVWERQEHSGFALGSTGAFLVIESKAHAIARGAKPFARLTSVVSDRSHRRQAGEITASLRKLWSELGELKGNGAILSGAPAPSRRRRKSGRFSASIRTSPCDRPARVSAITWTPSLPWESGLPPSRSPAAHCFHPAIPPAWRLKCPNRRPRLW